MNDSHLEGSTRRSSRTFKPTFKMKELALLSNTDQEEKHLSASSRNNWLKKNSGVKIGENGIHELNNGSQKQTLVEGGRKRKQCNSEVKTPGTDIEMKVAQYSNDYRNTAHNSSTKVNKRVQSTEIINTVLVGTTADTICETLGHGNAILSVDNTCKEKNDAKNVLEDISNQGKESKQEMKDGAEKGNRNGQIKPDEIEQAHDVSDEKDYEEPTCNVVEKQTIKIEALDDIEPELGGPNTEFLYCKVCKKTLTNKYIYKKHMALHSGIKPFRCVICDASFPIREYLANHMICHTADRKYKCDMCRATFFRRSNLSSHMNSHTEIREFQCKDCSKWFKTKAVRDEHMKYHGPRRHICEKCGKSFISATYLRKHVSVHEGIKPFKCDECGKSFPYQQSLQEHVMRHQGIKPVSCEVCGKGFNNLRQLRAHKKYHEAKTDFLCSLCNLYYDSLKSLKKHRYMSHATEYKCEHCDQTFKNKRVLVSHKFAMHRNKLARRGRLHATKYSQEKKVECNLCKRMFYNEAVLSDHLVNQHGLDKEDAERVIKAKDVDQIVIINEENCDIQKAADVNEVNEREQYRVYYKDEEIDVYVTVRKGSDKEITDTEAREIVNAFKRTSNTSLCESTGMVVKESGDSVKDLLEGAKAVTGMRVKCVLVDENDKVISNKINETSSEASKHVRSEKNTTKKVQNLWNNKNNVSKDGKSCYVVKKPDMAGTIKDNEELFVLVPNSNVASKAFTSQNTLHFEQVEYDEIKDVYEEIIEAVSPNSVRNVYGIDAANGDQIVLIVNKDENGETYMVDGQEYLEVVESELEVDNYGGIVDDGINDLHANLVTPNPAFSAEEGNNNAVLKYNNSLSAAEVHLNLPKGHTAYQHIVTDKKSAVLSYKGKDCSETSDDKCIRSQDVFSTCSNCEHTDSGLHNHCTKPDEFMVTVPHSNSPPEIAQFEIALRRKALEFDSFQEYSNFLDNMMLALQKAKVEQSIIFGTQKP